MVTLVRGGARHRTDRIETESLEMMDRSVGGATWTSIAQDIRKESQPGRVATP